MLEAGDMGHGDILVFSAVKSMFYGLRGARGFP
jgi:hypothetical protein